MNTTQASNRGYAFALLIGTIGGGTPRGHCYKGNSPDDVCNDAENDAEYDGANEAECR